MKPQDVDDDEGRQTADYNNTRGGGRRWGPKLAFVEPNDLSGDTAAVAAAMVIGEQCQFGADKRLYPKIEFAEHRSECKS